MSQIVCGLDGRYRVFVCIQDGTESCGVYATEEEAQKAWRSAENTLNHRKIPPGVCCAVEYELRVVTSAWATQSKLLQILERGEWEVLEAPPQVRHLLQGPTGPGPAPGLSEMTPTPSLQEDKPVRRIRRPESEI